MLHADIVYVLNATRLPGLSDECEKVERVGTQRFGLGEAERQEDGPTERSSASERECPQLSDHGSCTIMSEIW